jgi:hypothetical protein
VGGPLGGQERGRGIRGGEGQSGTNQGQVWTGIRATRVKGGFPRSKRAICHTDKQGVVQGGGESQKKDVLSR